MNKVGLQSKGFTIVELLIVVVVIAILAAITIVAYTGIQERARTSALQSGLSQGAKSLEVAKSTDGTSEYPSSLPSSLGSGNYSYSKTGPQSYCLSLAMNTRRAFVTPAQTTPLPGDCSGLVGLWLLNSTVADTSSLDTGATASNVTMVNGQNGKANGAYSFDGTSSAIVMSNASASNALKPSLPLSVSFWFNASSLSTTSTLFQSDSSQCGGEGRYAGIKIFINSNGALAARIGNGGGCGGASRLDKSTSVTVSTGRWYHAVVTFDASRTITVYMDGADSGGTYSGSATSLAYTTTPSRLGSASDGSERFNGAIDDFRMYNKVLSIDEIQALFSAGAQ